MSKLNIGWSEVSITPEKKISLAGQFAERISQYVEKPLTATAMAVECGGDQIFSLRLQSKIGLLDLLHSLVYTLKELFEILLIEVYLMTREAR